MGGGRRGKSGAYNGRSVVATNDALTKLLLNAMIGSMVIRRRKLVAQVLQAVGYVRVSTSKQDLGPIAQAAALDRWAVAEGAELVAVFLDIGVSGGAEVSERKGLTAALAFGAGAIVAAKRDRFARDVAIAGDIDRLAAKAGVKVLSADGGNGDNDGDALKRDLDAVLSAHERRTIRRRTRDALAVKRARGERMGSTPFGTRSTPPDHCPACAMHSSERRRPHGIHLEPDPDEQRMIARAKALSDSGLTVRRIAEELEREGFRNRAGKPMAFQSVGSFLRPLLSVE